MVPPVHMHVYYGCFICMNVVIFHAKVLYWLTIDILAKCYLSIEIYTKCKVLMAKCFKVLDRDVCLLLNDLVE